MKGIEVKGGQVIQKVVSRRQEEEKMEVVTEGRREEG